MDEKPVGFLQDDSGSNSSMRLMCLLSLLGAFAFGYLAVVKNTDNSLYVFFAFIVAAFAPKAIQKFSEVMPVKK